MEKQQKKINLGSIDINNLTGNLNDIINLISGFQTGEYENIEVFSEIEDDGDGAYGYLQFYGSRLETDAELQQRMDDIAKQDLAKFLANQAKEIKEKEMYLQLKQKYENQS